MSLQVEYRASLGWLAVAIDVVDVGSSFVWHFNGASELPQVAIDFIKRFDTNAPVSPFTFTLEVPAAAVRG